MNVSKIKAEICSIKSAKTSIPNALRLAERIKDHGKRVNLIKNLNGKRFEYDCKLAVLSSFENGPNEQAYKRLLSQHGPTTDMGKYLRSDLFK